MKTETLNVVRLSEDDGGESHFDEYPVSQILTPFAPPALPFFVSSVEGSSGYVTIRIPVGWIGERAPFALPSNSVLLSREPQSDRQRRNRSHD